MDVIFDGSVAFPFFALIHPLPIPFHPAITKYLFHSKNALASVSLSCLCFCVFFCVLVLLNGLPN